MSQRNESRNAVIAQPLQRTLRCERRAVKVSDDWDDRNMRNGHAERHQRFSN